MTDRELIQQALSVLCNNVYPRDGVRDNKHLTPKSHAAIYQQTVDALFDRLAQPEQEPVAWMHTSIKDNIISHKPADLKKHPERWTALYPAPRPWVGLEQSDMPEGESPMFDHQYFIAGMAFAAKVLEEKNTI
jgi:hypothetical protein